jgi:hypothetical protein
LTNRALTVKALNFEYLYGSLFTEGEWAYWVVDFGTEHMVDVVIASFFVGLGLIIWAFVAFAIERFAGHDLYYNIFGMTIFGLLGYLAKALLLF